MDFIKSIAGCSNGNNSNNHDDTSNNQNTQENSSNNNSNNNSGGGFMDKLNGLAGGGQKGEQNEDGLDKAVDYVQEKFLGAGDQSNESAAEQAKDEAISDFIREQYKKTTGSDFPIADKDKKFGM